MARRMIAPEEIDSIESRIDSLENNKTYIHQVTLDYNNVNFARLIIKNNSNTPIDDMYLWDFLANYTYYPATGIWEDSDGPMIVDYISYDGSDWYVSGVLLDQSDHVEVSAIIGNVKDVIL